MRQVKVELYSINELIGSARDNAIQFGKNFYNKKKMIFFVKEFVNKEFCLFTNEYSISNSNGFNFYGEVDLQKLAEKQEAVKTIVSDGSKIGIRFKVNIDANNNIIIDYNKFNFFSQEKFENQLNELSKKLKEEIEFIKNEAVENSCNQVKNNFQEYTEEEIVSLLQWNFFEFDQNGKVFEHPIV